AAVQTCALPVFPYMIVNGGATVTGAVRSKSATVNGSFQKSDGTTVPAGQFQPGNGSEFDLITNSGSLKPAGGATLTMSGAFGLDQDHFTANGSTVIFGRTSLNTSTGPLAVQVSGIANFHNVIV